MQHSVYLLIHIKNIIVEYTKAQKKDTLQEYLMNHCPSSPKNKDLKLLDNWMDIKKSEE